MTRAVVLLSGGLDSATCLALARADGYECHALTIAYGQRHRCEIAAAERVALSLGAASHRVISIDLRAFGGSALTDDAIAVPKNAPASDQIPVTYVPARNTIFLAYALGYAEVLDARVISIGANAVDYSGYPDCRPAFIDAFQHLANVATRAGVEGHPPRVIAPLMHMTKPDIIRKGLALGVNYSLTHSCYDPVEQPDHTWQACHRCDSCRIREAAFAEVNARP